MQKPLIRLQCYEGLDESKALYEWKYGKQLLYTQVLKDKLNNIVSKADTLESSIDSLDSFDDIFFSEKFLEPRPLLKAINSEKGSVLLIDEIDRADEEFEALLLEILAENQITIPEMGTIKGNENKIIILTSNNTRELSDALRRRCIYLYLDFPTIEIEKKVLMNSVEKITSDEATKYASLIAYIRNLNLNKIPSLIESVEWVKYNHENNYDQLDSNIGILIKDNEDQATYTEKIKQDNEFTN